MISVDTGKLERGVLTFTPKVDGVNGYSIGNQYQYQDRTPELERLLTQMREEMSTLKKGIAEVVAALKATVALEKKKRRKAERQAAESKRAEKLKGHFEAWREDKLRIGFDEWCKSEGHLYS